jgi:membrane protein YqaA with SNARE-associated domain
MSSPDPTPSAPDTTAGLAHGATAGEAARLGLRLLLGLLVVFGAVAGLARVFRGPLQAIGTAFVDRFGLLGMFVGSFVSDAFTVPIPPQFYLLTAVTSGRPQLPAIVVCCTASVLGGALGYRLATPLSRLGFFRRLLDRTRPHVDRLFARWGRWSAVVAGFSPLPFSGLCYTAGLYRMPLPLFAVFLGLRVPRILIIYAAIRAGWSL